MVVYDWYKEVEDFIGQNTMMVPRFEGYSFDSDGLWNYEVGDRVFLSSLEKGAKLSPRFVGPFEIVERKRSWPIDQTCQIL
jgi:hypothetical protein